MSDFSGWVWPLVAVVIGLALGMVLGAVKLRRGRGASAGTNGRDTDLGPASALPAGAAAGADAAAGGGTPQQRLLERLRAANLQLSAQLKSVAEANSRQMQEREQERQADRLRHEREMEELRQAHAGELSHLMNTLVEQVDSLNKRHAEQLKAAEAELERLRRAGGSAASPAASTHASTHASAGVGVTRPMPVAPSPVAAPGPAAAAAPAGGNTRSGGATASDYSVTLPMESFRER
ncbi:MAG: hypothetical protein U1F53_17115 [Burkholderiaceae bacterium]